MATATALLDVGPEDRRGVLPEDNWDPWKAETARHINEAGFLYRTT